MLARLAVTLCGLAPLAAQQTIVVQGGADALRIAVSSANAGDVLLVRAGTYDGPLVDKGITLRCDPGVQLWPVGRAAALSVVVPAGQRFLMTGGAVLGTGLFPSLFTDGDGAILFVDSACGPNVRLGGRQVGFQRCGLIQVRIDALNVPARDTHIAFSDCTVSNGCEIHAGEVTMAGGSVTGMSVPLFGDLPGFRLHPNAELFIAGDASTVVASGLGGTSPAPAIEALGGTVVIGPLVQLRSTAPTPITGPGRVITRPLPAIGTSTATAGQLFTVTAYGEVGSSTHVLANLPHPPWALPFGTLWLGANSLLLDTGIVPASGSRTTSLRLPANLPQHLPLVLQSITTLTNGALWVGPPTVEILN